MHWFPEGGGGADRYFHGLVTELIRADPEARGFVFGTGQPEDRRQVRFLGDRKQSMPQRLRKLRAAVNGELKRRNGRALIGTHFALYGLPLLDTLWRNCHVVHFHGPWADESAAEGEGGRSVLFKKAVELAVYGSGRRFVVLSEAFRNVLIERYRVPGERIDTIPGGVHAGAFDTGVSQAQARERLGWPLDRPIIVSVRRLARRMGLENLIEAIGKIRQRHPDILAILAGTGPLARELAERVRQSGLDEHVRLAGFVPDADLPFAYRAADLSVVPSIALEGFGLIVLESLAAGTPAVVTPVGGLPEVVRALSPKLILEGSTPELLAEGLSARLAERDKLPSTSECQTYARQGFDWPVITARVRKVYEHACS